jgi:integrase
MVPPSPIITSTQPVTTSLSGRTIGEPGGRSRPATRHAHATQLLAAAVHPKAVSERLGHSTVAFTMDVYSAVIPSLGRAAADAADQLFGEEGR